MKKIKFTLLILSLAISAFSQSAGPGIKMISQSTPKDPDLHSLLQYEGIDLYKISFIGGEVMKEKSFRLTVREIWAGKTTSESTVIDSKTIGVRGLETINDTVLNMRVMGKHHTDSTLKLTFSFPRFSVTKEYKALNTDDYSLRNIAEESKLEVGYNKKFYLLTYILPYKLQDGSKSWCAVGSSGKDIENWGQRFGVEHYLIFEMEFE